MTPDERAYWRWFDSTLDSALKVARIDQRALFPSAIPRAVEAGVNEHPTDYLGTVLFLADADTRARFDRIERGAARAGEPPQRTLADYGATDTA